MLSFKSYSYLDLKIVKQYAVAFCFSIIGALINFYFFRQVFHNIGEEAFYYYAYSRRVLAFVSPILILGLGVSLPRTMGFYCEDVAKQQRLFFSSVLILLVVSTLWILSNLIFNSWFTSIVWGDINSMSLRLNLILTFFLLGLNISAIINAYYRGRINALMSGIIEIFVQSLIPLFAFVFLSDLVEIYFAISLIILLFDILLLFLLFKHFRISILKLFRFDEIKELIDYGVRRIPGDLFYALIIFLPAFFAGKFFSIELAGVFSFGLSLLTLFNLPATAISYVTLSRSTQLLKGDKLRLRKETHLLLTLALLYSFLILFFCYIFLNSFLILFFEASFTKHFDSLFLIILALPMLVVFTVFRSITDSAFKRSYNSIFMFVALILFIISAILAKYFNDSDIILYGNIFVYGVLSLFSFLIFPKIFRV